MGTTTKVTRKAPTELGNYLLVVEAPGDPWRYRVRESRRLGISAHRPEFMLELEPDMDSYTRDPSSSDAKRRMTNVVTTAYIWDGKTFKGQIVACICVGDCAYGHRVGKIRAWTV